MTTKEKMMMQPTQEYIRKLLKERNAGTEDCILSSDLASEFGISAPDLHWYLIDIGILYREEGSRELKLYSKYAHKGYTKTRSHFEYSRKGELKEKRFPVWTETGQEFIRRLIRKKK